MRIYRTDGLTDKLREVGLRPTHRHYAHALHSPYWWLKCLIGVERDEHPLLRAYHRLLIWNMVRQPGLTRTAERLLDPLLGKSLVVYAVNQGEPV
ncbi:MAG: hypothetical protein GEV00_23610 [Actinophytocola sp.]|nr:hypothetical protein [Actinophytocola sp.]